MKKTFLNNPVKALALAFGLFSSAVFAADAPLKIGTTAAFAIPLEAAVAEAKTAVEGGDATQMTEKAQALAQVAMKLGQAIYEKEQAAAASPAGDAGETKADDGVVDAEFSEVDDNKA